MFDRDHPREASSAQQEQNNGCVLLSRWLPDEIDGHSGGELFQEFNKQHGTVDFTYSSAKVRLEVNKYGISSNHYLPWNDQPSIRNFSKLSRPYNNLSSPYLARHLLCCVFDLSNRIIKVTNAVFTVFE